MKKALHFGFVVCVGLFSMSLCGCSHSDEGNAPSVQEINKGLEGVKPAPPELQKFSNPGPKKGFNK